MQQKLKESDEQAAMWIERLEGIISAQPLFDGSSSARSQHVESESAADGKNDTFKKVLNRLEVLLTH